MASRYRVNSAGDLLGLSVEVEAAPHLFGITGAALNARFGGDVEDGRLALQLSAEMGGRKFRRDFPQVKVPAGGSVLLPMHPVNRLRGLRRGEAWNMRVFDPLAAVKAAVLGEEPELALVRARVRPDYEELSGGQRKGTPCLVIDCEGDGLKTSTWVAKERGLVLCQEATLDNQRWTMYRDRGP
jgi:hypothetical protein